MAQEKATQAQKDEAKALGVPVANGVGKDTLQKKIDEANAEFKGLTPEEIDEKKALMQKPEPDVNDKGLGHDKEGRKILAKGNGYSVVLNKHKM